MGDGASTSSVIIDVDVTSERTKPTILGGLCFTTADLAQLRTSR